MLVELGQTLLSAGLEERLPSLNLFPPSTALLFLSPALERARRLSLPPFTSFFGRPSQLDLGGGEGEDELLPLRLGLSFTSSVFLPADGSLLRAIRAGRAQSRVSDLKRQGQLAYPFFPCLTSHPRIFHQFSGSPYLLSFFPCSTYRDSAFIISLFRFSKKKGEKCQGGKSVSSCQSQGKDACG